MLEDVNDEIPLFTEREQETVLEGEPVGSKVTQVNAIDKDGTFPNNQVNRYQALLHRVKQIDVSRDAHGDSNQLIAILTDYLQDSVRTRYRLYTDAVDSTSLHFF